MTLYEIKENILQQINNLEIDEDTGEILNTDALDELSEQFEEKAENIALFIKNTNAEAEAMKREEKKLSERRKSLENKANRLKSYLSDTMLAAGKTKISTPKTELSFRKSKVVEIDSEFVDWAEKNADFLLDYKEPTPSKTAIKDAISNGSVFEFARLVENQNLVIK